MKPYSMQELEECGFLSKIFGSKPTENGWKELNNLLAAAPDALAVSADDVHHALKKWGVKFNDDNFNQRSGIYRKLAVLEDVGLGYIHLGQAATTLSGGEAQRVKLATELSRRSTGRTVYILDEPTTGLHIADVHRLIEVLQKLEDEGNTVIVIEHNLDLIKCADYIIDLGPEGGSAVGRVIAEGTPEQVAEVPGSFTGQYLKPLLEKDRQLRAAEAETGAKAKK